MNNHQKSSTIMYTVIDRYSSLLLKDKQKAISLLEKARKIVKPIIDQYSGEWHKDTLSSFLNPTDAVNCAVEIQRKLKLELDVKLKIGIHVGDVLFGMADGVKVANGIGELAEPGSVGISEQVYYSVRNNVDIEAEFFGEKALENVNRPIKVYSLKIGEESEIVTESHKEKAKPSIAVLPFVDMSPEKDQEWFCDGIAEEIINALSHIEDLKVIARTSTFFFKGKDVEISEIGNKLKVENVLEGSVRKAGNKLRITAQLIKIDDLSHLWSEAYKRDMEDVFAIQEEISLAIVEALKVKLLRKERTEVVKCYTEDIEIYNLYLKGIYFIRTLSVNGIEKAIECFQQAIQKDPNYALAFAGLCRAQIEKTFWYLPPNAVYPKAREYAEKALKIDSNLAEAHAAMGMISTFYEWEWGIAEQEYNLALKMNPNSAAIHEEYSCLLSYTGQHDKAIKEAKCAVDLDPLSGYINGIAGLILNRAGQFDEAINVSMNALTINPNDFTLHTQLGSAYRAKSMYMKAIEELEKAVELSGESSIIVASLAATLYLSGKKSLSEELFNSLIKRSKQEYIPPTIFYIMNLLYGNLDNAFEWLKTAYKERDGYLLDLLDYPEGFLRYPPDPRFKALLREMGLSGDQRNETNHTQ